MSDSTLRASALLSVRREMVGWEAGVRLGAKTGVEGAEVNTVTSPPPLSPSPLEDEGGVCSKKIPSSTGEERGRQVNSV